MGPDDDDDVDDGFMMRRLASFFCACASIDAFVFCCVCVAVVLAPLALGFFIFFLSLPLRRWRQRLRLHRIALRYIWGWSREFSLELFGNKQIAIIVTSKRDSETRVIAPICSCAYEIYNMSYIYVRYLCNARRCCCKRYVAASGAAAAFSVFSVRSERTRAASREGLERA